MLGEISALTIATPDLEVSLGFYKKLGFKELHRADMPFPWIQISDGVLLIMLRKDPKPYIALTYYVKDIEGVVKKLEQLGIQFITSPKKTDMVKRYLFQSPDGLNISLVGMIPGFTKPVGPSMLQMEHQDYYKPNKYVNKTCGMFGELAHPVIDLDKSIAFWEMLGLNCISKFDAPYPWAIVTDGLSIVGLHHTSNFNYPAITYFAVDMKAKINNLLKQGTFDNQQQNEGNIILTTPEQQHFFLYTLGGGEVAVDTTIDNKTQEDIILHAIAYVSNTRTTPIDDNWGNVISEITLIDTIPEASLTNITDFSHLEIIYYFNQVVDKDIVFSGRPRGNPNYPNTGIFAQRKKDRPNKIGLCTVMLLHHNGKTITVSGLDAINGTPILDIKPVMKEFEPNTAVKQPEWVGDLMKSYWEK